LVASILCSFLDLNNRYIHGVDAKSSRAQRLQFDISAKRYPACQRDRVDEADIDIQAGIMPVEQRVLDSYRAI